MKKENLAVGIDLGTQNLKAVLLDLSQSPIKVLQYNQILVSDSGKVFSNAELKEILQANFKEWNMEKCQVHMATTSPDVIVRYMESPRMNASEFRNSLQYEADRYLPFKLSEAYFDSNILLEQLPDEAEKMLAILVAAKKTVVEEKLNLFTQSGINLDSVDVSPVALMNAYDVFTPAEEKEKDVLLIDLGASRSSINIISERVPQFTREVEFSGVEITNALMKKLNKKFYEVEQIKTNEEIKWEGPTLKLINAFITAIKASINYVEAKSEKTIEHIFISGGGGGLVGLNETLSKELERPVEKLSFKTKLDLTGISNAKEFEDKIYEYAIALGLAVKGLEI